MCAHENVITLSFTNPKENFEQWEITAEDNEQKRIDGNRQENLKTK